METKKIFLSPSNQKANIGAYINTNEHEQCELIAQAASKYLLENYICEVNIAEYSDNMKTRAQYANASGTDIYLAIHTNAFRDPAVMGTETFFYSGDENGKQLAVKLLDDVAAITGVKRSAKANDSLIELNTPVSARAYIEVDFHTNPERAKWMQENTGFIGETIGRSIAEFAALAKKENTSPQIPEKEEAPIELPQYNEKWVLENIDFVFDTLASYLKQSSSERKYYRVQAGAYTNKENAERLAEELKKAGFNTVIKYY